MTTVRNLVVVRLIGMITKIPDIAHRTRAKRLTTCCGTSTRRLSTKIRKTCINKEIYISTEGYYKTNPYWYKKKKRNEDCSFIFISEYVQDLSLYLKTTETASFTFLIKSNFLWI